jgi:hypothetical protein
MKSDKSVAIDAIGQRGGADIKKLFGDCDANSAGVKKALKGMARPQALTTGRQTI